MKVFPIVLVVILFLVAISLWLPVCVKVQYKRQGHDDSGKISVRWLFGLVRLQRQLLVVDTQVGEDGPVLQVKHQSKASKGTASSPVDEKRVTVADVKQFIDDLPQWVRLLRRLQPIVRKLMSRVHIQELMWHTKLGTGNAVTCGMSCGAAWGTTMTMVGSLSQVCQLDRMPDISVVPDFDRAHLETSFECILHVRAGYAIRAGFGLIRVWRRRQTHGASDSRTHAHSDDQHP